MNNIEFICSDEHILKYFPIVPAKDCLPEWYSKLKANEPNISKCMPVRDMITSGYIIPNAYEQEAGSIYNEDTDVHEAERIYPVEEIGQFWTVLNQMTAPNTGHTHDQCPVDIDGRKKSYFKINLPWRIKTPPGYSCIFMQPFYQFNKDFTLMPGIIDTDEFDLNQVNFPCYINGDEGSIKVGQPLVQIIPFKRDEWTHNLSLQEKSSGSKMNFFLHNMYKRAFHKKKKFQ